ncbi:hypothetical protein ACLB2K_058513 [Fragaria x ananassa]
MKNFKAFNFLGLLFALVLISSIVTADEKPKEENKVPKSPVRESSWVGSYSIDAENRFYPGAGGMVPSPQVPKRGSRGDGGEVPSLVGERKRANGVACRYGAT